MHAIDLLQTNLSEIYSALHANQNENTLPLYATSSSHVYDQRSWIGRMNKKWDKIWRLIQPPGEHHTIVSIWKLGLKAIVAYHEGAWIRQINKQWRWNQPIENPSIEDLQAVDKALKWILTTLFDESVYQAYDARQMRILNHMEQIDRMWQNRPTPQDLVKQSERYVRHLEKELTTFLGVNPAIGRVNFNEKKKPISEEDEKELRHTIVNFHQTTYLFWSLFIKNDEETRRLCLPLMRFIPSHSTLTNRTLFQTLEKEGRWVQLEGIMHQTIPVALFAKLYDPDSLTLEENKRLTSWVKTLNSCQQELSAHLLYIVLTDVITIIELQGSSPVTLQDLLFWLHQHDCSLLEQEDAAHMDWREGLHPGDTLECNGKTLVLGNLLSPNKFVGDVYKVFELIDYPNYVVKIAHNRFRLLIENKQVQNEEEHWGVRFVATIDNLAEDDQKPLIKGLDLLGSCVVLEKLVDTFDCYVWASQEWKLTEEDEKHALVFANHLFCMNDWKASAQNLSLAHLMWDKKGILKSTRLLKKGQPNYNEWEVYCENAAKGNPFVLNFLMHVSKLNEHKIAIYYRKVVEDTLKTGHVNLIGRALPFGYRQDYYQQRIKNLCLQAKELRTICLQHVTAHLRKKRQYSYEQDGQLQAAVAEKLIEFYRASPIPGRFCSSLQDDVVKSFINQTLQRKPEVNLVNAQAYYQEKHELMMRYNQTSLGLG
jgi:hypothetical protein